MINGKVIAIFVKCAKFVTEKKKEEKEDKPQFYSFRPVVILLLVIIIIRRSMPLMSSRNLDVLA